MSDLVRRLRATTDGATVNPDGLEAAAEIERLRAALAWIDQQRYTGRCTINPANGYDRAVALNERLLALMDAARAALTQEARDE